MVSGCGNCFVFAPFYDDRSEGHCRRHAPGGSASGAGQITTFPMVLETHFCGEFRPKRLGVPGLSTCKECRFWLRGDKIIEGQCRQLAYITDATLLPPRHDFWCSEFFPRHPDGDYPRDQDRDMNGDWRCL